MYRVEDLFTSCHEELNLELFHGRKGLNRKIKSPEVHRPGLSLSGYMKNFASFRILVFGKMEIEYLRTLDSETRRSRLEVIVGDSTPAVFVARRYRPPKELSAICEKKGIPLFRSSLPTMALYSKLLLFLTRAFSPQTSLHGTLMEVFGVGVLIQGDSSVGKSEAALGLLESGHRLISDDVVKVKKTENNYLVGYGPELTRHLLEIRGIGIINVAHLYGAVSVRPDKAIDVVIKLEEWNDTHFYDRVGLEEKFCDILGVNVPFHILPVKPGRDVTLLIETIVLNFRLKEMGYHSAKEFQSKLMSAMGRK